MPDAQPKPTAAEVLREHQQSGMHGVHIVCRCRARVLFIPQHQADMLAAAGLLATAEHDAQVLRDAADTFACDNDSLTSRQRVIVEANARYELRARADRIEAGDPT